MILARVPLRVCLGGGGTDDPRYVKEDGGFAITAALDKHIYISVNRTPNNDYLIRYSETERTDTWQTVKHPIIRAALEYFNIPPGVEIVSMADLPSGTGLGSSGAFTVALCMALSQFWGGWYTQRMAAEDAARIELELLKRPGGQQDHFACAMGDVRWLKFTKPGYVYSSPVDAPQAALDALEGSLHLYYTGTQRDAGEVLSTQTTDGLAEIKHLGYMTHHRIVTGDIAGLGKLMNEHWWLKRKRSADMSNTAIDLAYAVALDNGAIGGKLVGAGGGGFLLAVAENATELTPAMAALGMPEVPFKFDHVGATLIST